MTIEQPRQCPQTKAYLAAAQLMRAERYWQPSQILEEQIAFLQALESTAKEIMFQLSRYKILEPGSADTAVLTPISQSISNLQLQPPGNQGPINFLKTKRPSLR